MALFSAFFAYPGVAWGQKSIAPIDMSLGDTERNTLSGALWDGAAAAPVTIGAIEWEGAGQPLVRRLKNQQPRYTAGSELGSHLADALSSEARAMGLHASGGGDAAWKVSGSLDEISLDERRIPYGPLLFYAFMRVTLDIEAPDGTMQTGSYDLHDIFWRYNAGFGARDEAREAVAAFLVGAAQDLLARLNREFFGAPPSSAFVSRGVGPGLLDDGEGAIREIGLAGSSEQTAALLRLLDDLKDEADRVHLVNALALMGDPSAVEPLGRRYAQEDEDVRFYILKALDYLGPESRATARELGRRDEDNACRRFAERLG